MMSELLKICDLGDTDAINTYLDSLKSDDIANLSSSEDAHLPMLHAARYALSEDGTARLRNLISARMISVLASRGFGAKGAEKQILEIFMLSNNHGAFDTFAKNGLDYKRYSFYLVRFSIANLDRSFLKSIMSNNVDPNTQDSFGGSAIHDICSGTFSIFGKTDESKLDRLFFENYFKELISFGCDINLADKVGATPLMRAIVARKWEICFSLLKLGATIDKSLKNGVTALDLAISSSNMELVRLFSLSIGADWKTSRRLKNIQPDIRIFIEKNSN